MPQGGLAVRWALDDCDGIDGISRILAAGCSSPARRETAFRYYQTLIVVDPVGHSASLGAERSPAWKVRRFAGSTSGAYSPSYLYQLFPSTAVPALGDGIVTAPDYQVEQTDSYQYRSDAALSIGSPRRTTASIATVVTSGRSSRQVDRSQISRS